MRKIFVALFVCSLGFVLVGCSNQDKPEQPQQPTAPTGSQKIEAMPETSEEAVRIHRFDAAGVKYEIEITYRDGTRGLETLSTMGAVKEYKRFQPGSGKLLLQTKYSADGKRIVMRETFYKSGKIQEKLEHQKNGERRMSRYAETGELIELAVLNADGSGDYGRYARRGNAYVIYLVQRWKADGELFVELYDREGRAMRRHVLKNGQLTSEGFRSTDGKLSFRQFWQVRSAEEMRSAPFAGQFKLLKVEVIAEDGKIQRTLFFGNQVPGNRADRAEIPQADGSVREIVADGGTAEKVFVRDAAGGRKEVTAEEGDAEQLHAPDWSMASQPSGFNPGLGRHIESLFQTK